MRLSVQVALTPPDASLVQLAEHRTFNAGVRSSSLRRRTTYALSSAGQSARFRFWRPGVRFPQSVPHARMAKLEYAPG